MLEPAARPPMTLEQSIRGKDEEMASVVLVTGYNAEAVTRIANEELAIERFETQGANPGSVRGKYRLDFLLTAGECRQRLQ
jgi:hypothetical protein